MAPNDDEIFTIYDDDPLLPGEDEEEIGSNLGSSDLGLGSATVTDSVAKSSNVNSKRKRETGDGPRKKRKAEPAVDSSRDINVDGEFDSDFEFQLEDGIADIDEDDDDWAEDVTAARDIDDIVAARKTTKHSQDDLAEDEPEVSDEELLAQDAFGMGADHEEGSEDSDADSDRDTKISDADNDEDAETDEEHGRTNKTPRPHPHDVIDAELSDDESHDEAEEERRKAYFAPESDAATTSTSHSGTASFMDFHLPRPILRGLTAAGFSAPTPIQARTIPMALNAKDIVGSAVTGSGKTGAFMIPILHRLFYRSRDQPMTRVVILLPTRELALQAHAVATKLASFTDITFGQAIGGMNQRVQETALKLRPDVVIATPGRFIDFMRNSTALQTDGIEILVLDEADRMLEDGFADELNEILTSLPKSRQTMLFSATMTSSVDDLIRVGCNRPVRIAVDSSKQTVQGLTQEFIRLRAGREHLRLPYLLYLCTMSFRSRTIIFFRQKALAHRIRVLFALCDLTAAELHGNMTQEQRIQAVEAFRSGSANFLLATDLASRGLDIKNVDAVINYDAPQSHEIYLHRVGRTARAGRKGRSCTLTAESDRKVIKAAVKAARAQGAIIKSRTIAPDDSAKWESKIASLEDEIDEVLKIEKEERVLRQTEMTAKKAENMMTHEKEIMSRPKKTWFQGEKDKVAAKEKGRVELNGIRPEMTLDEKIMESLKNDSKKKGKLSNKQKKRLDLRDERNEGRMWKKGSHERGKKIDAKGKKAGKPAGQKGKSPKGKGKH